MSPPEELRSTPFSVRYADTVDEWIDVYGHAVPLWISDPDSEYNAIRNGVGLLEYSMLYKWHVEGADAVAVVDSVVSRDIRALPQGRLAYGVVASPAGTMIDDVTVAVVSPHHVVVTGGNPTTEEYLRAVSPVGTTVTERRDESAVLSIQGPHSRALLEALTTADVSNEAFPYYSFISDVMVAGVPATVNRVGFTAELGYEVMVARENALTLWDAAVAAGEGLNALPISAAALMMARIEAGMIMGEVEYDSTVSPFECRMGWAIDFSKSQFQGRDALIARQHSDTGRVVTIRCDAPPESCEGRALHHEGVDVGVVTMAVPSPLLRGATVAMARVHRDYANVSTRLTVVTEEGGVPAEVMPTPLYDPDRRRVRS